MTLTRTTLVVLSVARRAGPHAALGLELAARRAQWDRGRGRPASLDGIAAALTIVRHRYGIPGSTLTVRHACA